MSEESRERSRLDSAVYRLEGREEKLASSSRGNSRKPGNSLVDPVHPPGFLSSEQSQLGSRLEIFDPAEITRCRVNGEPLWHHVQRTVLLGDCNKNAGL